MSDVKRGKRISKPEWVDLAWNPEPNNITQLLKPLSWTKPRLVSVDYDLFTPGVTEESIWRAFAVMAAAGAGYSNGSERVPGSIFQIVTRYPKHMGEMLLRDDALYEIQCAAEDIAGEMGYCHLGEDNFQWPLPNVWLGTLIHTQEEANDQVTDLLRVPAAIRFISCVPTQAIDLDPGICQYCYTNHPADITWNEGMPFCSECGNEVAYGCWLDTLNDRIDWVMAGAETGTDARPVHPTWIRQLRDQCLERQVPFYFTGWGEWQAIDLPWTQQSPVECAENEQWLNFAGGSGFHGDEVWRMRRVGREVSGRLLDGRAWDEMPPIEGRLL